MNLYQVRKPGIYNYRLPSWESAIQVKIILQRGAFWVYFRIGFHPVKLSEVPTPAIFEFIEELEK